MFILQGKFFILTYPRCDYNKDDLLSYLVSLRPCEKVVVCHEFHADGTNHLHAAVSFEKRHQFRNADCFDFKGAHGNYQKCRSWPKCVNYVRKSDDYCFWPEDCENLLECTLAQEGQDLDPNDFGSEAEWLLHCLKEKVPFGYAKRIWDLSMRDKGSIITENIPGIIRPDLDFLDMPNHCSVVIIGPTGIGKTTWACNKMEKPILLVTHMDDLRKFDKDFHKSILFDDMTFAHMPETAQIHLADFDLPRSIHVRYGTAHIPARTKKVFTSNEEPFSVNSAIARRIKKLTFV